MLKKMMITGCTLFLLTACGTDATNESTNHANETTKSEDQTNLAPNKDESSANQDSSTSNAPTTPTSEDILNPAVSLTDAVKVFKEAHPDAKIESVDFDKDSGRLHYEIEGFDGTKEYEMEIDAMTKEIRENEVDKDRDTEESLDFSAIIDPSKAIEIASATAEVEGHSPTGWVLEADDGKQKYTIEYDDRNDSDIDIKINALTGEIIEIDKD